MSHYILICAKGRPKRGCKEHLLCMAVLDVNES